MDIIQTVVVSAFAVAYLTELLSLPVKDFINPKLVVNVLTLPFSFIACWFLGIDDLTLAVAGFSVAFLSTALAVLINAVTSKVQVIPANRNRNQNSW